MNLKIFETPRLRIRPSVWDDVETFFQWEQQPAVTEFFSIRDGQTMEETARKFLKDQENPNAEQFTILLKTPDLQGLPATRSAQDAANVPQSSDAQDTRASLQKIGRIVLADIERGWKGELWRIYIADSALARARLGTRSHARDDGALLPRFGAGTAVSRSLHRKPRRLSLPKPRISVRGRAASKLP